MGKAIRCPDCGKRYRTFEQVEELRDNDGICLQCDAEIEVEDWDRVLASFEDEDLDDVDDDEDEEFDDDDDLEDEEEEDDFRSWPTDGNDPDDDDDDDDFGGFGIGEEDLEGADDED